MGVFGWCVRVCAQAGLSWGSLLSDVLGGLLGEGIEELLEFVRDRRINKIAYEKIVKKTEEFARENGVEGFLAELNEEIGSSAAEEYLNSHRKMSEKRAQKLEAKAVERYNKELVEAFYDRIEGIGEDYFSAYKVFQKDENRECAERFIAMINEIRRLVLEFKFRHLEEEDKILAGVVVASVKKYFDEELSETMASVLRENLQTMFYNAGGFTVGEIAASQDALRWAKKCCPNCGYGGRELFYDEKRKEIYCGACGESYFAVEDIDGIRACIDEQSKLFIGSLNEQGIQITDEMKREFRTGLGQIATKDYLSDRLDGVESTLDSMQKRAETARASLQQCVMEHIDAGTDTVLDVLRGRAEEEERRMMQLSAQLSSVERMVGAVYRQVPEIGEDVKEVRKLLTEVQKGQDAGFQAWLSELKSRGASDRDEFAATLAKSICSQIGVDMEKLYKKQDETLKKQEEMLKEVRKANERADDIERKLERLMQFAVQSENGALLKKCETFEKKLDEKQKKCEKAEDVREKAEGIRELNEIKQEILLSIKDELTAVEGQMRSVLQEYRRAFANCLRHVVSPTAPDDSRTRMQKVIALSGLNARRRLLGKEVITNPALKACMNQGYERAAEQIESDKERCGMEAAGGIFALTGAHIRTLEQKLHLASEE